LPTSTIEYGVANTKFGAVRYAQLGPEDGEKVLFSTGGGVGYHSILAFEWLAKQGYRMICISRPGYFDLPIDTTLGLDYHADVYHEVLTALGIEEEIHVFGVSMGGLSALYYAQKYPTKSLVLWCAVSGKYLINKESANSTLGKLVLSRRGKKMISFLLKASVKLAPRSTISTFLEASAYLDNKERRAIARQVVNDPQSKREFHFFVESMTPMDSLYYGTMDEAYRAADLVGVDWSRITCPTFAVYSTIDKDVTLDHAERLEAMIPGITMMYVKAGGHYVWWGEEGKEVKRKSWEFIRQHTQE